MDKNHFISLLSRYSGSSAEEAEKLLSLKSEYPYSQLIHTLVARVTKDHGFGNPQEALQIAAVHAADRSVLKEIISQPYHQIPFNHPSGEAAVSNIPVSKETQNYAIKSIDSIDVADEVLRDLEKLNTLRHNFEMLFVEYSEVTADTPPPVTEESIKPRTTPSEITESKKTEPKKKDKVKSKKSKKERIIELAKAMKVTETTEEQPAKIQDTKKKKSKDIHQQPDKLIEEIRSTKREIVPESDKQKEQIALINQFIKAQPSLASAKDRQPPPSGDLNPIKSGEFGDNIVSETLVEILVKQGKKDKAIEVLKKLIWKYPQKKAYFASQIEDLKK